ncbi:MAG: helix-turn-helix transcriptional regulator [Oscillospiraceae bacterium]|jgi:transcriptional regulator with XRE-family HTH domain|nr:helix-turn-helix transcriptional regulator [Oscillospiraceae bacterium]
MSFGTNLQFLRKMRRQMTQEELAEKMGVSRQTVSKWELDAVYPEMEKVVELCQLFSCTMDQLVREDMALNNAAYSNIREEIVEPFWYLPYTVVSMEPEDDSITHVNQWAKELELSNPDVIGWDFPVPSQELINVHNMHGYTAALVFQEENVPQSRKREMIWQDRQKYMAITIRFPMAAPFQLIPNAYKVLMTHMSVNGIAHKWDDKQVISCFERSYHRDGVEYMDVFIAAE